MGDEMSMTTRRTLLAATLGTALAPIVGSVSSMNAAHASTGLSGMVDAVGQGMRPGATSDQGAILNRILKAASVERKPVFLAPGAYLVSNIDLPDFVHLHGIEGLTRLRYGGTGHLMRAENASDVHLQGLVLDGRNRPVGSYVSGLLQTRNTSALIVRNCRVTDSAKHGLSLETTGGSIVRSKFSNAQQSAIYSVQSSGIRIAENDVSNCANGGILVHRWEAGMDGSTIHGNRIRNIRAQDGGTGQNGNGINVFRANNVMVANNWVTNCAFSAIRSNSGSNVQIIGNQCLSSGETAIYSEFSFEGAIVSNNLVDGAANGISIANLDQRGRLAIVSDNLIRNLSPDGPYEGQLAEFGFGIGVEADTVVTGNVIEAAPTFGILIGWGPYLRGIIASNNFIRDSAVGIAVSVVEGASGVQISNNVFQNIRDGAIVGYRWNEATTNDLVKNNADRFDHLTISQNTVM